MEINFNDCLRIDLRADDMRIMSTYVWKFILSYKIAIYTIWEIHSFCILIFKTKYGETSIFNDIYISDSDSLTEAYVCIW